MQQKIKAALKLTVIGFAVFGVLSLLSHILPPQIDPKKTDGEVFNHYDSCPQYEAFLAFEETDGAFDCYPILNFIMASTDLSDADFIYQALEFAGPGANLRFQLELLKSSFEGQKELTFYWADEADRAMFGIFQKNQDPARAYLYSYLTSDIKHDFLWSACLPSRCRIRDAEKPSHFFGADFANLDKIQNEHTLLCLTRLDGFVLPIESLLKSPRFESCLSRA